MTRRNLGLKELRRLLNKVAQNHRVGLYLPFSNVRNPTWDEVREHAADAYAAAIRDVLNALAGDPAGLEAAISKQGRPLIREEYVGLLTDAIQDASESRMKNPLEDLDDRSHEDGLPTGEESKAPRDSKE
jgi:hypothetical protein